MLQWFVVVKVASYTLALTNRLNEIQCFKHRKENECKRELERRETRTTREQSSNLLVLYSISYSKLNQKFVVYLFVVVGGRNEETKKKSGLFVNCHCIYSLSLSRFRESKKKMTKEEEKVIANNLQNNINIVRERVA